MEFGRRHTELISFAWCYPEKPSCQHPEEQAIGERWWPKPWEAGKIEELALQEILSILQIHIFKWKFITKTPPPKKTKNQKNKVFDSRWLYSDSRDGKF